MSIIPASRRAWHLFVMDGCLNGSWFAILSDGKIAPCSSARRSLPPTMLPDPHTPLTKQPMSLTWAETAEAAHMAATTAMSFAPDILVPNSDPWSQHKPDSFPFERMSPHDGLIKFIRGEGLMQKEVLYVIDTNQRGFPKVNHKLLRQCDIIKSSFIASKNSKNILGHRGQKYFQLCPNWRISLTSVSILSKLINSSVASRRAVTGRCWDLG